jgi:hypothetical protein
MNSKFIFLAWERGEGCEREVILFALDWLNGMNVSRCFVTFLFKLEVFVQSSYYNCRIVSKPLPPPHPPPPPPPPPSLPPSLSDIMHHDHDKTIII